MEISWEPCLSFLVISCHFSVDSVAFGVLYIDMAGNDMEMASSQDSKKNLRYFKSQGTPKTTENNTKSHYLVQSNTTVQHSNVLKRTG